MTSPGPILEIHHLSKTFPLRRAHPFAERQSVRALNGVTLSIGRGETLALVGESGCGKSTLGKCLVGLEDVSDGAILFEGTRIDALRKRSRQSYNKRIQMIFQDPLSSLNPRMRIGDILGEPMRNYRPDLGRSDIPGEVERLLRLVRMPVDSAERWPHEFSGGQAQRIAIARALASDPDVIVCDEATSALDVSIKAQIVNLLRDLQERLNLGLLFISHDLGIVRTIAHRVAVMYRGVIVEQGPCGAVFRDPEHPYTQALLSAILPLDPGADRDRKVLEGEVPPTTATIPGCPFASRCDIRTEDCWIDRPALKALKHRPNTQVACLMRVTV